MIPGKELGHLVEEIIVFLVAMAVFAVILFFIIRDLRQMNLIIGRSTS